MHNNNIPIYNSLKIIPYGISMYCNIHTCHVSIDLSYDPAQYDMDTLYHMYCTVYDIMLSGLTLYYPYIYKNNYTLDNTQLSCDQ